MVRLNFLTVGWNLCLHCEWSKGLKESVDIKTIKIIILEKWKDEQSTVENI